MLAWRAYFTHPARISTLFLSRKVMYTILFFSVFICFYLFLSVFLCFYLLYSAFSCLFQCKLYFSD